MVIGRGDHRKTISQLAKCNGIWVICGIWMGLNLLSAGIGIGLLIFAPNIDDIFQHVLLAAFTGSFCAMIITIRAGWHRHGIRLGHDWF